MLHLVSEDLLSFNNCLAIISRLHVLATQLCPEVMQFVNHSLLQLIPSKSKDLPENRVDIGATELLSRLAKDKSPGAGSKVPFTSLYGNNIDEAQLFRQIINTALNLVDI